MHVRTEILFSLAEAGEAVDWEEWLWLVEPRPVRACRAVGTRALASLDQGAVVAGDAGRAAGGRPGLRKLAKVNYAHLDSPQVDPDQDQRDQAHADRIGTPGALGRKICKSTGTTKYDPSSWVPANSGRYKSPEK